MCIKNINEINRLGCLVRQRGNWSWPFTYAYALLGLAYFKLRSNKRAEDLACFGWHCVAVKEWALTNAAPFNNQETTHEKNH
jgi:hypothetical protein